MKTEQGCNFCRSSEAPKMAQLLYCRKTCKPSNTSFNFQKKYAFRSSVGTSMCTTLVRNHHFFSYFGGCITYLTHFCRPQTLSGTSKKPSKGVGPEALFWSVLDRFLLFFNSIFHWFCFLFVTPHPHRCVPCQQRIPSCFTLKVCTKDRRGTHTHTPTEASSTRRFLSFTPTNECDTKRSSISAENPALLYIESKYES